MAHNGALRAELASARQRATAATQQRDRLAAQLETERGELQKMAARAEALVGAQQSLPLSSSSQRRRTPPRVLLSEQTLAEETVQTEEARKVQLDDGTCFIASELITRQDAYLDELKGAVVASEQQGKQMLMTQQDAYLDELSGVVNRLGAVSLTKAEAEVDAESEAEVEVEAAPATPAVTALSGPAVTAATMATPPVVPFEQLMARSEAKENVSHGGAVVVPGKRPSSQLRGSPPPRRSGLMDLTNQLPRALGVTLPSQ